MKRIVFLENNATYVYYHNLAPITLYAVIYLYKRKLYLEIAIISFAI